MRIFDISVPVRPGMHVYPGDPAVDVERVLSIAAGDGMNLTRAGFGLHTGTHVDAPLHFVDGASSVDELPLDALVGPAIVVDATRFDGDIGPAELDLLAIPSGTTRILFKTRNSRLWERDSFSPEFVGLTPGAATQLVDRGVQLVGIDYLSIAPASDPAPTHIALLRAAIVIVEGLDLRQVEPGEYMLACLPLRVAGADGAPARAVLWRD
ncbi:MAG: cyclase family protein [Thermoflexaceae bacterium]|nr:cyclase family protein [Thermoflexaceae bacterium]